MSKKMAIIIGALVGVGSAIPIFVFGLAYDLIPFNKYAGVFWMCFIPLALYYSSEQPQMKNLLNMTLSYILGLCWGYLGVVITPAVKMQGVIVFAVVEYLILVFLILFVTKGLLGKTLFNNVPCTFIGFALSIAASTTRFWSGHMDTETFQLLPTESNWNQLDLFVIFICGIVMTILAELLCKVIIGSYMKKHGGTPLASHETSTD